jgi:hypothetical protein
MAEHSDISITVLYRGNTHPIAISSDSTWSDLQATLEELTNVPPSLQKLLYKGKKPGASYDAETTLLNAGIRNGLKVQMLSPTAQELEAMHAAENEKQRRERIMRERALKGTVKVSAPVLPFLLRLRYYSGTKYRKSIQFFPHVPFSQTHTSSGPP